MSATTADLLSSPLRSPSHTPYPRPVCRATQLIPWLSQRSPPAPPMEATISLRHLRRLQAPSMPSMPLHRSLPPNPACPRLPARSVASLTCQYTLLLSPSSPRSRSPPPSPLLSSRPFPLRQLLCHTLLPPLVQRTAQWATPPPPALVHRRSLLRMSLLNSKAPPTVSMLV
jgi:hypothetical protein